eukprot:ANDGO_07184.mRNA.1 hypothetical protein AMSG_08103
MIGALGLLRYGHKSYATGYFQTNEFYFGLAGLSVLILALVLVILFVFFAVIRIRFTITPSEIRVRKSGLFRKCELVFSTANSVLFYYRSHFVEDRSWLTLTIAEDNVYYLLLSWKGTGNQRARFFEFMHRVNDAVHDCKLLVTRSDEATTLRKRPPKEIISMHEASLRTPFANRPPMNGLFLKPSAMSRFEEPLVLTATRKDAAESSKTVTKRSSANYGTVREASGESLSLSSFSETMTVERSLAAASQQSDWNKSIYFILDRLPLVINFDMALSHFSKTAKTKNRPGKALLMDEVNAKYVLFENVDAQSDCTQQQES